MAGNTLVTRLLLENGAFDNNLRNSRAQIMEFDASMKKVGSTIFAAAGSLGAITSVSAVVGDAINKNISFEKAVSGLQSLTGLAGEELEYISQQAIRLGSTTTQSANQVAEAFTLIGSKMPDLLKVKEALVSVTEDAIVLAEAAGINVTEAAGALTGALNQMGKGAAYAGDYINILAAASKEGAADIPYLNAAIERSGGAASSVGIQFNELVAAIEAIAPKFSEASQAGTSLRNIFLTLESSSDKKLKPSVVGLGGAIEELSKRNYNAAQMTKLFGKENVTAALAIVNAKDSYLKYEQAITGTNTAFEQQRINTDNVKGALDTLKSSWEGLMLSFSGGGNVIKGAIYDLAGMIDAIGLLNSLLFGVGLRDAKEFVGNKEIASRFKVIKDVQDQFIKDEEIYYRNLGKSEEESKKLSIGNAIDVLEKRAGALDKNTTKYKAVTMAIAHYKAMLASIGTSYKPGGGGGGGVTTTISDYEKKKIKTFGDDLTERDRISIFDYEVNSLAAKRGLAWVQKEFDDNPIKLSVIMEESSADADWEAGRQEEWNNLGKSNKLKELESMQSVAGSLNSVLSQTAGILSESGNEWGAWGLQALGTIASVVGQYASLIAMQMASSVAEQGKLPFPYNIAAMAATAGGIISIIASLPKFATGGIIGGNSFAGDNVLIRANSGEMILNKGQQARLMNVLDGGASSNSLNIGNVEFRISGSNLVGVLSNYNKKTSKLH